MTFIKSDCVTNGEEVITLAQRIMGNGVITIPTHDFKQQSRWYYQVWEVKRYEFRAVIYGITSIPNFVKILTDIVQLFSAHRQISQVKDRLH
jgi:hypothetical protein